MKSTVLFVLRLTSAIALLGIAATGCVGTESESDESFADFDDSSADLVENSPDAEIQSAANSMAGIERGTHQNGETQAGAHQNGETQGGAAPSQVNAITDGAMQTGSNQVEAQIEEPMAMAVVPNLFSAANAWTKDVSALVKDPKSDTITNWLKAQGGWGFGIMKIDFGLTVLQADAATPKKTFTKTNEFYSPDCDSVSIPVPAVGSIEAEQGYSCTGDGDCHLIVVNKSENKLYEMWRANISNGTFYGGCAAVWDLTKAYSPLLRGDGCTSADAGGFPIASMLFTTEEVKAGVINHAIRFILPNARIRDNVYVRPATHSTFPTAGGPDAPPYGVRFRLRKDFPLNTLPTEGARVIARAIQKYGMILSDGGNIALTGASDKYSAVKWTDVGVNSNSLNLLKVTDMEVVDMGLPMQWSGNCVRVP